MGIAGFFLWLKQYYSQCIENVPQPIVDAALNHTTSPDSVGARYRYDNLYIDMNGLMHPCCHDTFPLPEPKTEEEMFQRIFDQLDLLVKVVRPKKCLVLCVDGVAPRSKMNQQRSRRFRSVDERVEGDQLVKEAADEIEQELGLPRPESRSKWDHNVITPATAFMDRLGEAIEWFIVKMMNEDSAWKKLTVVYSDAHVPGEGEHKIMQYIRGLRSQPGYNPSTSHVIHGMDADLICLGLSVHEEYFSILRNQLTETFQPDHNKFCYLNLHTYRAALREDFSNIVDMDFERVLDDYVYLCFFVGNDFLPHIPLLSIKTQGIELLLDHYVRKFDEHGYLTKHGEVNFTQLAVFLRSFVETSMPKIRNAYHGVERAKRRAIQNVGERVHKAKRQLAYLRRIALARQNKAAAASAKKSKKTEAAEEEQEEWDEDGDEEVAEMLKGVEDMDDATLASKILSVMSDMKKEQARFVANDQTLPFSYLADDYRDAYYKHKFGWDPEGSGGRAAFEKEVRRCCAEYFRGTQWVMRYYTKGCPSWSWYYPYHYAPLLQDLAAFDGKVDVEMELSSPLHPVEQLLAVLPRQSVHGLPEPLHEAVLDPKSPLGPFYPEGVDVDFSEANFSYQGVQRLPFIDASSLQRAVGHVAVLEPDVPVTLVFCHEQSALAQRVTKALKSSGKGADRKRRRSEEGEGDGGAAAMGTMVPISAEMAHDVPIAGRIGLYKAEWPLHAKLGCPDDALAAETKAGGHIHDNAVRAFRYEMVAKAKYRAALLSAGGAVRKLVAAPKAADGETPPSGKYGKQKKHPKAEQAVETAEPKAKRPRTVSPPPTKAKGAASSSPTKSEASAGAKKKATKVSPPRESAHGKLTNSKSPKATSPTNSSGKSPKGASQSIPDALGKKKKAALKRARKEAAVTTSLSTKGAAAQVSNKAAKKNKLSKKVRKAQ